MRELKDLLPGPGIDEAGLEELALDGYEVRWVGPAEAVKDHICPSCGETVPAGEGHVLLWPVDDSELRHHWHRDCWRLEVQVSRHGE